MKKIRRFVALFSVSVFLSVVASHARIYVDSAATGANDGTSWEDAYVELTSALATAVEWEEIWVAQGVYYPADASGDRTDSFRSDTWYVLVYGGFASGMESLEERDWDLYPTILDGDIQRDNDPDNNVYHVITGWLGGTLDGVTIRNGNASLEGTYESYGGGVYLRHRPMTAIRNCRFENNLAFKFAGGMYLEGAGVTVSDCLFTANNSRNEGGALYVAGNGLITDCQFVENTAHSGGAAMVMGSGNETVFRNCSFIRNTVTGNGGAIRHEWHGVSGTIEDCLFVDNVANGSGGAISMQSGSSPVYRNSVFVNNSAGTGHGGAIYALAQSNDDSLIEIDGCLFLNNRASSNRAGAISLSRNFKSVSNSTFVGNQAEQGGAIYMDGNVTDGLLQKLLIVGNKAQNQAGGIYGSCSYTLEGSTLAQNKATSGGALYGSQNNVQSYKNSIFWGNSAENGNVWYLNTGLVAEPSFSAILILTDKCQMLSCVNAEIMPGSSGKEELLSA